MIYRFQKAIEYTFYQTVEANSFEEAKELVDDENWEEDEGGESFLTHSSCKVFEDEDALEDFDEKEELEWEP